MPDRSVECHDRRHGSVDTFGTLFFVRLNVTGWIGADVDVIHHPPERCVSAVRDASLQHQLHQLFAGWGHVLETLAEWHDGESVVIEVLTHLNSAPSVIGYFFNVVLPTEFFDEVLYETIMNYVPLSGHDAAFGLPQLIAHVIT